jgi:hypothetical protein
MPQGKNVADVKTELSVLASELSARKLSTQRRLPWTLATRMCSIGEGSRDGVQSGDCVELRRGAPEKAKRRRRKRYAPSAQRAKTKYQAPRAPAAARLSRRCTPRSATAR